MGESAAEEFSELVQEAEEVAPEVGEGLKGAATKSVEQLRNALGQFMTKSPGQTTPGSSAVDDFVAQAEQNGYTVIDREVTFETPFGLRRYDVILENPETGATGGIEIKSSMEAMDRWDAAARQQFAADRWINMLEEGATSIGMKYNITITSTYKILWELPK